MTEKRGKQWCTGKGNIPYFEVSAKKDLNVDAAFETIARNALKNEVEEDLYVPETVDMNTQSTQRKAAGCCG